METPHEHDEPTGAPSTAEPRNAFLEEKAFKSRTVLLFGEVSDRSAADIARRLIALDAESDKPIDMLVSSPGGHLESGDAIHAKEIIKARERIAQTIARETGKPLDSVLQDIERDRWLSAEEAIDYGLVGRIIQNKAELRR